MVEQDLSALDFESIDTIAILCSANDEPGTSLKIGDPPGTNSIAADIGVQEMADYAAPNQSTSNDANWNLSLPTNS